MGECTPIILLASERSGTNLLRAVVSSHSKVASPPPCGLVDALARRAFHYITPSNPPHIDELIGDAITITKIHLNPWGIDLNPQAVLDRMNGTSFWQLFKALNDIYAEEKGQAFWFSKEPSMFEHIYEIKMHMPNAKFIYMVRDGRDVAASVLRGGVQASHIYDAANRWVESQRYCMNAFSDPVIKDSTFMLKYEDLITDSESIVKNLMEFIGLDFESSQMEFHQKKEIIKHSSKSEFWKNISKPIDSSNMGKYRKTLKARQIEIFESTAWEEMRALGYQLENNTRKHYSFIDRGIFRISSIVRNKLRQFAGAEETKKQKNRELRMREIINRSFNN